MIVDATPQKTGKQFDTITNIHQFQLQDLCKQVQRISLLVRFPMFIPIHWDLIVFVFEATKPPGRFWIPPYLFEVVFVLVMGMLLEVLEVLEVAREHSEGTPNLVPPST